MDDFEIIKQTKDKKKYTRTIVVLSILLCIVLFLCVFLLFRNLFNKNQNSVADSSGATSVNSQNNLNLGGESPQITPASNGIVNVVQAMDNKVAQVITYTNQKSKTAGSSQTATSVGSGFIISSDGYVVTNNHVIENGVTYKVRFSDTEEYDATLIGADPYSDLAVLKIDKKDAKAVAIADSTQLQVGELAVAFGSPINMQLTNSVTSGVISALNREISVNGSTFKLIQTDAAINPGNSGGPLVNNKGEVVGINVLKTSFAGYDDFGNVLTAEGIGFAIPISDAMPIIEKLITDGKVPRVGIGVSYYQINKETSTALNVPIGLLVSTITSGSPAAKAGIQAEDIIVKIDGKEITEGKVFTDYIKNKNVGDSVTLTVFRQNANIDLKVTLEDINSLATTNETTTSPTQQDNSEEFKWQWPF